MRPALPRLACLLLALSPAPPQAANGIWRCVDDLGRVTWSDLGCRGPHTVHPLPTPGSEGLEPVAGNGLDPLEQRRLDAAVSRRGGPRVAGTRPAHASQACRDARAARIRHGRAADPGRGREQATRRRALRRAEAAACR